MKVANLFRELPPDTAVETIEPLLETGRLRLERIVSHGQATPPGVWYD
jgi:cupin 2 domain-containing protein